MKHYLIKATEAITIYKTPKKIMELIQREMLIKNPPYNVDDNK